MHAEANCCMFFVYIEQNSNVQRSFFFKKPKSIKIEEENEV